MPIKIHVGNLFYGTTAETLRIAFAAGGRQVVDVSVPTGMTGEPRGFAFVQMATEADAEAAIAALDHSELDGRAIRLNLATGRVRSKRAGLQASPTGTGRPAVA